MQIIFCLLGASLLSISSHSLALMREQLDTGADVSLPIAVQSLAEELDPPVYTLHDFTLLEESILSRQMISSLDLDHTVDHLSLWKTSVLKTNWEAVIALLKKENQGQDVDSQLAIQHAGLHFPFGDYFGETRSDILPYIPNKADTILEIGCGRGFTGALLQQELGCRVTGIDIHSDSVEDASTRLHQAFEADAENFETDQTYDVVMFLDVIEHLHDPLEFMKWSKRHLNPGGSVVGIVPNVGHYSVVRDLIAGRWDYVPMGILCITHRYFFTRSGLERTLAMAGFTSWSITGRTTPKPEDIEQWRELTDVDIDSLGTDAFYFVANL